MFHVIFPSLCIAPRVRLCITCQSVQPVFGPIYSVCYAGQDTCMPFGAGIPEILHMAYVKIVIWMDDICGDRPGVMTFLYLHFACTIQSLIE